jgi:hypothetical protein
MASRQQYIVFFQSLNNRFAMLALPDPSAVALWMIERTRARHEVKRKPLVVAIVEKAAHGR